MLLALDLDGTLVTCEPRQSCVLRAALAACRQQADIAAIWELKRNGASTRSALEVSGMDPIAARSVSDCWQSWIETPSWLSLDSVLPGVMETLMTWRERDFTLLLLTARSRPEWLPCQLRHLGLSGFFTHVISVSPSLGGAEKARVLSERKAAMFIGDTESDAAAAQLAGVPFIGVTSGQRSRDFLSRTGTLPLATGLAQASTLSLVADPVNSAGPMLWRDA